MKNAKLILGFLLVLFLQIAIFNQFFFAGYLNPYCYVLFLILLPTRLSRAAILVIAFLMGLSIDVFENSAGVHAAASVLVAYLRPLFFTIIDSRREDAREKTGIRDLSFPNLIVYSLIFVLIHHFSLFLIESFSFRNFDDVLMRTLNSSIFTFSFILLYHIGSYRKRRLS